MNPRRRRHNRRARALRALATPFRRFKCGKLRFVAGTLELLERPPFDVPSEFGVSSEHVAAAVGVPLEVFRRAPLGLILLAAVSLTDGGRIAPDVAGAFKLERERQERALRDGADRTIVVSQSTNPPQGSKGDPR